MQALQAEIEEKSAEVHAALRGQCQSQGRGADVHGKRTARLERRWHQLRLRVLEWVELLSGIQHRARHHRHVSWSYVLLFLVLFFIAVVASCVIDSFIHGEDRMRLQSSQPFGVIGIITGSSIISILRGGFEMNCTSILWVLGFVCLFLFLPTIPL